MEFSFVLLVAASLAQLAAAFLAVRLIPTTGARRAWILIGVAMVLMILRRWLGLFGLVGPGGLAAGSGAAADAVALVISLLLALGLATLRPTLRKSKEDTHRTAERAAHLAAEGEQQRTLVNRLPIAVIVLIEKRIAFANTSFLEVFGIEPDAAVGSRLEDMVVPSQRAALLAWLEGPSTETDASARFDCEFSHTQAGRRWVALRRRQATWGGSRALLVTAADVTAAKRAAQELEESEVRFRSLAETVGAAITIFQGSRFVFVNQAALELSGYSREELSELDFWSFVHPDHRDLVRQRGLARQKGEVLPPRYQFKIVRKNGEERWVDASVDVILYRGAPAVLLAAFDITPHKEVEEKLEAHRAQLEDLVQQRTAELRASEERFRALAENSLDVIMRFDRDCRHLYANPIVESQTGIRASDFIGKTHRELGFPEELCNVWEGAISKVFRTGQTHRIEFQLPSAIWIDWLLIPEFGADGSVHSVITAARDITERKTNEEELRRHRDRLEELVAEATADLRETNAQLTREVAVRKRIEAELRRSEARFRSLYDNATIGLYRTTPAGRIELANPAMWRMLGFSSFEELSERNLETVGFTEEFPRSRFREMVEQRDEIVGLEYPMRRADGTIIWVRENAKVVRAEDGSVAYYEGTVEDTTQRRALEERLRQSQKLEALGTFAGGVAHDFNNLLMAALGATELLQRRLVNDESAQQELAIIHRAATRGAELSNSLLAFARRRILERHLLNLGEVVEGVLPMLRRVMPENIAIVFASGAEPVTVRGDRGQLEQILMNLASNARDAMPSGGTIHIKTAAVALDADEAGRFGLPPGDYVRLTFTDTGEGMDTATLARAFEPFFTTKAPGQGTGMGLASVYGMVEQHGGYVRAESTPGGGTTIEIHLPRADEGKDIATERISGPIRGGAETVLVVEDEEDVRNVLTESLAGLGYDVIAAEDGVAALEVLQARGNEVQLVISDVVMPRMGGRDLRLAAAKVAPRARFLFSSGYSQGFVLDGLREEAGDDFIAKPYGVDDLARKVREMLDRPNDSEA